MLGNQSDNTANSKPRSTGLTFICILTFIGSGFSAVAFFVIFLIYNEIPAIIAEEGFPLDNESMLAIINNAERSFFLTMTAFYLISFAGALMMWNQRKKGFHFYTTAQLMMLLIPFFMVTGYTVPLPNALITSVFIGAYGLNMGEMR